MPPPSLQQAGQSQEQEALGGAQPPMRSPQQSGSRHDTARGPSIGSDGQVDLHHHDATASRRREVA
eukprot:4259272-Alexandrium_andersonii.AAC.1